MFDKKEYQRNYYQKNKDKISKQVKQWKIDNPEYNKQWAKDNPKHNKQNKQWRENNPEYNKQYYIDNKEKIKKHYNRYRIIKRRTDIKCNLNNRITTAINISLKGNKNGRHWETLVGYTLDDLVKRLKKTMPEGYGWQDYLKGKLHIDHIIPVSVFNFDKPEDIDFQNCWALNNLQLLSARENIIKSNKLDNPFQPALKIYSEVIKYE